MARVSYCTRDDLPEDRRHIFDRLEGERASPVSNIFRAVAHAHGVLESRLAYGSALRNKTSLAARYRELSILTVARLTEAEYAFARHKKIALKAGVSKSQIDSLGDFEASTLFTSQERAVMRYAREATLTIKISDETWRGIAAFLDEKELVELVLNVAWYNQTARVMVPLQVELEDWFESE